MAVKQNTGTEMCVYLGTLTVEEVFQDREKFASEVRKVASPDVSRMGIEIVSFTIKDVFDKVDYLGSLGRAQTANVKRDADIGVAEAHRDAGIQVTAARVFLLRQVASAVNLAIIVHWHQHSPEPFLHFLMCYEVPLLVYLGFYISPHIHGFCNSLLCTQSTVHSLLCAVYCVQSTVCSVQSIV